MSNKIIERVYEQADLYYCFLKSILINNYPNIFKKVCIYSNAYLQIYFILLLISLIKTFDTSAMFYSIYDY